MRLLKNSFGSSRAPIGERRISNLERQSAPEGQPRGTFSTVSNLFGPVSGSPNIRPTSEEEPQGARRVSEFATTRPESSDPLRTDERPSSATKLSGRAAFGGSLRRQPESSLWPGRAGGTPDPGMAVSVADCWQRSKLNCIASVSESSRMSNKEESQERIGRRFH